MTASDQHMELPFLQAEGRQFPITASFTSEDLMREHVDSHEFLVNGGHRSALEKIGVVTQYYALQSSADGDVVSGVKIYGSLNEASMQKPQLMNGDARNTLVDYVIQELGQGTWAENMRVIPEYQQDGVDTRELETFSINSFRYAQRQAEAADYLFTTTAGRRVLDQTPIKYRERLEKFITDALGPKDDKGLRHPPSYEEKYAELNQ